MSINPKFIMDVEGKQTVVLTVKEFNELMGAYEDLEDIKSCEGVKRRIASGESETISFEQMKEELRLLGKLD